MLSAFSPAVEFSSALTEPALWFIFRGEEILVNNNFSEYAIPYSLKLDHLPLEFLSQHYLGTYKGIHCFAAAVSEQQTLATAEFKNLRQVYGLLSEDLFALASKAKQILTWEKAHRFCGYCGSLTETSAKERAKICPACQNVFYPRLSPAIIVLITRGEDMLLARSPHFTPGVYSTLAGFVEPGESAEEALHREVMEEVGLEVTDLTYFGSQSWPFPHSLMLGYHAHYASGEIKVNQNELEDAKWFHIQQLPKLPSYASIARKLINHFLQQFSPQQK